MTCYWWPRVVAEQRGAFWRGVAIVSPARFGVVGFSYLPHLPAKYKADTTSHERHSPASKASLAGACATEHQRCPKRPRHGPIAVRHQAGHRRQGKSDSSVTRVSGIMSSSMSSSVEEVASAKSSACTVGLSRQSVACRLSIVLRDLGRMGSQPGIKSLLWRRALETAQARAGTDLPTKRR